MQKHRQSCAALRFYSAVVLVYFLATVPRGKVKKFERSDPMGSIGNFFLEVAEVIPRFKVRWWQLNVFLNFAPNLGEMDEM